MINLQMQHFGKCILQLLCLIFISSCSNPSAIDDVGPLFEGGDNYIISPIQGTPYFRVSRFSDEILLEEGLLLNNRKHGSWVNYSGRWEGKVERIENYLNGQLHGALLELNAQNQVDKISYYVNGKLDGQMVQYNYGKTSDLSTYRNGLLDGIFKGFYASGKVQQTIDYKAGKKDGKLTYYNEEGEPTLEYQYAKDQRVTE